MRVLLFLTFFPMLAACQNNTLITEAEKLLAEGKTVSSILEDEKFDSVHPEASFRSLIKKFATGHSISIASEKEPGNRIIAKGIVQDPQGKLLANTQVYFYQTDVRGWYGSDRVHFTEAGSDQAHARLFGYLRTDNEGRFEIRTIQPNGYPQSDLPAHIHFEIYDDKGSALLITELLFDDDERLVGNIRTNAERARYYISNPRQEQESKLYTYTITVNDR